MENKTLKLAKLLSDKYKNVVYHQHKVTPKMGGIYLPILKSNAKEEAQKLELLIEEFIKDNERLGDITAFIIPNKNPLILDHPKNWTKNLPDGFNHLQTDYDICKNLTEDKKVEYEKFDFKFMPKSMIFFKCPKDRNQNSIPTIQTNKMHEKGKNKFTTINGKKIKTEEYWGVNKYYYFFIKEI